MRENQDLKTSEMGEKLYENLRVILNHKAVLDVKKILK
jgi:hypothetical protein